MKRRQELEKADPRQNDLTKDWQFTYLNNTIRRNDMDTLRPGKDINDTIINFYLVLLQTHYISPELRERVHCFNTYFITQLVGKDLMIDENEMERIGRNVPAEFEKRIERNYQNVQKWSKKADLFQKQLIVIPVNMPGHWCLIMVLRPCGLVDPKAGEPCILFLDSMNERNKSVVEAIRMYTFIKVDTCRENSSRRTSTWVATSPSTSIHCPTTSCWSPDRLTSTTADCTC